LADEIRGFVLDGYSVELFDTLEYFRKGTNLFRSDNTWIRNILTHKKCLQVIFN